MSLERDNFANGVWMKCVGRVGDKLRAPLLKSFYDDKTSDTCIMEQDLLMKIWTDIWTQFPTRGDDETL